MGRFLQILFGLFIALLGLMIVPGIAGLINGWDAFVELALTFLRFGGVILAFAATIAGIVAGGAIIVDAIER